MGAVWGIIDLNKNFINESYNKKMFDEMQSFKLDRIDVVVKNNFILGNGINHINDEDLIEQLPYYDEENNFYLVGDMILDNRDELIELLNLDTNINVSSGKLIVELYKRFNEKMVNYIIGDFCFLIYEVKKNSIFVVRDHVGSRNLFYYLKNNKFIFGTVVEPLLKVIEDIKINEEWVASFLIMEGTPLSRLDGRNCVYKDIYHLEAAKYLKITTDRLDEKLYWNPLKKEEIKFKDYDSYVEKFNEIFNRVVSDKARTNGEVGLTLSGGLDSTAVGVVAKEFLDKEKKVLRAYSSVPLKDYEVNNNGYFIYDESEYIEEFLSYVGNIKHKYVRAEGKSAFNTIDEFLDKFKEPYKIFINEVWINEAVEMAKNEKCKVMLTGQFGNSTISYGDLKTFIRTKFDKKQLVGLLRELRCFSKADKISFRKILRYSFKINNVKMKRISKDEYIKEKIISEEVFTKYNLWWLLSQSKVMNLFGGKKSFNEVKEAIMDPMAFTQIGFYETVSSLKTGVLFRDPTKDKRILEFCLNLPIDIMVHKGLERALIRSAMKDKVPDKIRLNRNRGGYQGADWSFRLEKYNEIEKVKREVENILDNKSIKFYINDVIVKNRLNQDDKEDKDIFNYLSIIILSRFLGKYS